METVKRWKSISLVIIDIFFILASYFLAFYFSRYTDILFNRFSSIIIQMIIITIVHTFIYFLFRLYRSLWTYASVDEILMAIIANIITTTGSIVYFGFNEIIPIKTVILGEFFTIAFTILFRISFRIYRSLMLVYFKGSSEPVQSVMIIGAGDAGNMLIKEMKQNNHLPMKPVALIDDDLYKIGKYIGGVKVYGGRDKIIEIAENFGVGTIILAIPSISKKDKVEILNICKETRCKIKIVPEFDEIINGNVSLKDVRDVEVEDLLGRDPIKLDMNGIGDYIRDRVILVTGGGGSIGSELCRQIAQFKPERLLILDIYENNAYDLQNELKYKFPDLNLKVLIASVRDRNRLEEIFSEYSPEIVFHAAAHKHVPLMEDNPSEAVKNNVLGTLNVAECADKFGVKRFVMISTDKAVNPTNVMGATKRICEMIIQSIDKRSNTEFVAVRFGNVLGSNGSVIPLFKRQIQSGGPVTVTHRDIIRFFMTIPEAAQLVLQAGVFAKGGEIFILDMGKPVRIYDLACDLIRLSGLKPNKDIEVQITGLRPGEKLYEEVLMDEEGLSKTKHDKIFVGKPMDIDFDELKLNIESLRQVMLNENREQLMYKIQELVPTYTADLAKGEVASSKNQ